MNRPKRPWEVSALERGAARAGIAFERNDQVPLGKALLACGPCAACIIVSDETADSLTPSDDSALWAAIAHHGATSPAPALVHLPSGGGDGSVEVVRTPNPLQPLAEYAVNRARSFVPVDEGVPDTEKVFIYGPEGIVFEGRPPPNYLSSSRDYDGYYKRFLSERADQVLRLEHVRSGLIQTLREQIVAESDERPRRPVQARRQDVSAVVLNERGGRVAKVESGVGIPPSDEMLVVADEFDRPAATRALQAAGLELPFDPAPGWLNASVRPGRHAWVYVRWSGEIEGRSVELELARLRSRSGRLTVFAAELAQPIEILLRRAGLQITEVRVENHPDDPEFLFGVDIFASVASPIPRKLRPRAKSLLPARWAEQLEKAWCPEPPPLRASTGQISDGADERRGDRTAVLVGSDCRLCDGPGDIYLFSPPYSVAGYCPDCCRDAFWGVFVDDGDDNDWKGAVLWALQTLAEVEFGGAPARTQLGAPPADGPNVDLLVLCRMLTARRGDSVLGADRRSYGWTDWLAEAGLLKAGVRLSRGVSVTAKDGHICRSMLERVIDDFLFDNGIAHEIEPPYPYDPELNPNASRADWKLPDGTFVEALGFPADAKYMAKVDRKTKLAGQQGIPLLMVTQADIHSLAAIFEKWIPPDEPSSTTAT